MCFSKCKFHLNMSKMGIPIKDFKRNKKLYENKCYKRNRLKIIPSGAKWNIYMKYGYNNLSNSMYSSSKRVVKNIRT